MSDSTLLQERNEALAVNPNRFYYPLASDINITTHGSDWYWAVTGVMTLSSLIFILLSLRVHRSKRIFHYITAAITFTAAIAYFTMASNLGYAAVPVEFQRSNPKVAGFYREIFYVRYIDWVITTPLLLLDLLLTAGLPWPTILYTLFMDEIMIITGLVGALVVSRYKWGYFVFAMVALFFIAWNVVFVGRKHATALGTDVRRVYTITGTWTIFLWFLYPVAWGVSEGGNVISPDSEAVFYGVLDILAKPVFGALLLWGHRNIDPAILGLHIRDYDEARVPRNSSTGPHGHGQHNGTTNALGEEEKGHTELGGNDGHGPLAANGTERNGAHATGVDHSATGVHPA